MVFKYVQSKDAQSCENVCEKTADDVKNAIFVP